MVTFTGSVQAALDAKPDLVDLSATTVNKGADLIGISHATSYKSGTIGAREKMSPMPQDAPWLCDPTGAVDCTTALQTYFDYCATNGLVATLRGKYLITATLTSNVRGIDGGANYVDSNNKGTLIDFKPTVLTDLMPAVNIAGGMTRGGRIENVTVAGNQPYTMMQATTWCPRPTDLPNISAFAPGPVGFRVVGNNQPSFNSCQTMNVKVGRLDDSDVGHIYSNDSFWGGWLAGVYCRKNTEDYQFRGGIIGGVFANYIFGTTLAADHYGGVNVFINQSHMGFSPYGFYQVIDSVIPGGQTTTGVYGEISARFEQIGECAINTLDSSSCSSLDVVHVGFLWSDSWTDWENTAPTGWCYNLHPSIIPYASQQKYALRLGKFGGLNRFNRMGEFWPFSRSLATGAKIARVAQWNASGISFDSTDLGGLQNDIDIISFASGSRRWRQRLGGSIHRDDLLVRQGILSPNLLKNPEILANWSAISGATLAMSDLTTVGGTVPTQMYEELGDNPAVLSITPSATESGAQISQFSASQLNASPNRAIGVSFWVRSAGARHRILMTPTAGGVAYYYDVSLRRAATPNQWTKIELTGQEFVDKFGTFQIFSSLTNSVYPMVYIAGVMVFTDEAKPYNPSPSHWIPGGLPTSATGLPSGSLWSNNNAVSIVP